MWKRKRAPEQDTETSLPQEKPRRMRNDTTNAQVRGYGYYVGDLMEGDEGIDDPPEQA